MGLFTRRKPQQPTPRERRPTAADRALEGYVPPRRATPQLPVANTTHVPVPVETANRIEIQREAKLATQSAVERVKHAEQAVAEAELELTKVRARARFGEATAEDIEAARAAVDAAQEELRDARRDGDGGILAVLDERRYVEQQARIEANRGRLAEELRGLAACYAEELQLERDLAIVRARRLEFQNSVHAVAFTHASEMDTPLGERAPHLIERVRAIVVERLGLAPKPVTVQVRAHPDVAKVREQHRAILAEAERQAKRARPSR